MTARSCWVASKSADRPERATGCSYWDPAFLLRDNHSWTLGREELLAGAARRLQAPTLLLVGGESDVVDSDALAELLERVPHATVDVVPGAGHMVAADENDAFGDALLAWLATLETR